MESFLILMLLALIAVGSLCLAAYSHYRAEREKRRRKLVRRHSRQTERLARVIRALDVADEHPALAEELNQVRRFHTRSLTACDPHSQHAQALDAEAAAYRHTRTGLADAGLNLAEVKAGLEDAAAVYRELHARDRISSARLAEAQAHLRLSRVLLDIRLVEERAQERLATGDRREAIRDFRSACSLLIQAPMGTPGREARIAALKQQIAELEGGEEKDPEPAA